MPMMRPKATIPTITVINEPPVASTSAEVDSMGAVISAAVGIAKAGTAKAVPVATARP